MDDRDLQNLIRAVLDCSKLDAPRSADQQTIACLSMLRLDTLTRADLPPTERERRHLSQCTVCRARFEAFARAEDLTGEWVQSGSDSRVLARVMRCTAVAAAACLILLLYIPRTHVDRTAGLQAVSAASFDESRDVPIVVCHEPSSVRGAAPRIDCFPTATEEHCLVLAVFRAWDEACQCLNWQVYEWDEAGRTLAELDPQQPLDIARNVTDNPPVEQLLLLASSRYAGDLPATADDAAVLLACLNDIAPPTCGEDDVSVCALALRECLPARVTLVPQTFHVD